MVAMQLITDRIRKALLKLWPLIETTYARFELAPWIDAAHLKNLQDLSKKREAIIAGFGPPPVAGAHAHGHGGRRVPGGHGAILLALILFGASAYAAPRPRPNARVITTQDNFASVWLSLHPDLLDPQPNPDPQGGAATSFGNFQFDSSLNLKVDCITGCSASAGFSDNGAFTVGTSTINPIGGYYTSGADPTVTSGSAARVRMDAHSYLFVDCVVGCAGGSTTPTDAFANPTSAGLQFDLLAAFNGTTWDRLRVDGSKNLLIDLNTALPAGTNDVGSVDQHGTWNIGTVTTVTSPVPTNSDTTIGGTSAPSKELTVGGKTNDATAQYQPIPEGAGGRSVIIEGFAGGTKVPVDGSGVTQPVNGTVTANQGTPNTAANSWPVEQTDGTNVLGVSAHPERVDPTGTTTQPVSAVSLPLPTGAATSANQCGSVVGTPCVQSGEGTGNSVAYLNCDSTKVYDASTNGTTLLVAAPGSSKNTYICGFQISTSQTTAVHVKLEYGTHTTTDCDTGANAITPNYPLQAASSTGPIGLVVMTPGFTGLKTGATNNQVCIVTDAAASVQAIIWYTSF